MVLASDSSGCGWLANASAAPFSSPRDDSCRCATAQWQTSLVRPARGASARHCARLRFQREVACQPGQDIVAMPANGTTSIAASMREFPQPSETAQQPRRSSGEARHVTRAEDRTQVRKGLIDPVVEPQQRHRRRALGRFACLRSRMRRHLRDLRARALGSSTVAQRMPNCSGQIPANGVPYLGSFAAVRADWRGYQVRRGLYLPI